MRMERTFSDFRRSFVLFNSIPFTPGLSMMLDIGRLCLESAK